MVVLTLVIVAGVCAGVSVLLYLVQRFVPHRVRQKHNDVAGFVYAVMGVLYAVMLGFVVVNEWGAMESARSNSFTEANELGSLYWNARALPPDQGNPLEATAKEYATVVIEEEWPLMAHGNTSPKATALVYTMRDEVNSLPNATAREQTLYAQSLDHVNKLASARRQRLSQSADGVPTILWVALVVGAVLTVGYTLLFGLSSTWAHLLIAAPLGVLVATALVLVNEMDHPFAGVAPVSPDAFHVFLNRLPPQR
ncbi:DUF4239 domain-containing protein [Solihabitans fulvus]|uniref:DUF4239 domain-containing protein n=1 Tax=Solihabitans fulvus TaxID=1892852 RepID=A0A5B2XS33_9PSEU|nr:DUF4239 domain-containing protein [Solihabitans fulvus]KAA2265669.1 DUF4239 domain-containing protein [Solihabitans fulvus]